MKKFRDHKCIIKRIKDASLIVITKQLLDARGGGARRSEPRERAAFYAPRSGSSSI